MSDSDAGLIGRAATGDPTAFQMLYERHGKAVYRFASLLTSSIQDGEYLEEQLIGLERAQAVRRRASFARAATRGGLPL